ncbi:hypothetical protein DV451_003493 [Geotrichum candidum]|uniref:Uncharacterized protein n=1 Tax=Geotrichum candidum TaxID=1173061 RepID=A0A9P5KTI3_GEOCN|nr:hypothetical protein DV451_003493 [Geotrichum candidum]KAF5105820.1 hypothetical protein DV453_004468 [Geotrichum candidum]
MACNCNTPSTKSKLGSNSCAATSTKSCCEGACTCNSAAPGGCQCNTELANFSTASSCSCASSPAARLSSEPCVAAITTPEAPASSCCSSKKAITVPKPAAASCCSSTKPAAAPKLLNSAACAAAAPEGITGCGCTATGFNKKSSKCSCCSSAAGCQCSHNSSLVASGCACCGEGEIARM